MECMASGFQYESKSRAQAKPPSLNQDASITGCGCFNIGPAVMIMSQFSTAFLGEATGTTFSPCLAVISSTYFCRFFSLMS